MTEAASKFIESRWSALADELINSKGVLSERGKATITRMCEDTGDDPATAAEEVRKYVESRRTPPAATE